MVINMNAEIKEMKKDITGGRRQGGDGFHFFKVHLRKNDKVTLLEITKLLSSCCKIYLEKYKRIKVQRKHKNLKVVTFLALM